MDMEEWEMRKTQRRLGFEEHVSSTGYVFRDERNRYQFRDVCIGPYSLNRGTCVAKTSATRDPSAFALAHEEVASALLPTTLRRSAPIVDITRPLAGHYFDTHRGVCFDAYLGVGQRLLDENHPNIRDMTLRLLSYHALLRREAATNDVLIVDPASGMVTPQALAGLLGGLAAHAFPRLAPYKAYLCSSGAEAIEASMKIACLYRHKRLLELYGPEVEAELMRDMGIRRNSDLDHPEDRRPVYEDYPFFFISARGAFHGRTLGALSLTSVRPVNKRGFPAVSGVRRVDFNGDHSAVARLLDRRDLVEILSSAGGVRGVLDQGRIPRDLVCGFVIEPFQGEGGYHLADGAWLKAVVKTCQDNDIAVIADEIQSFARTGNVFACEYFGVQPDIVAISKSAVVGASLVSARYASMAVLGWHSTTWGGGKVLENNYAWTLLDTYLNYHDELFGSTYLENQRVKAEYIERAFEWLALRHPGVLLDCRGLGGMWGFSVRRRDEVTNAAWRRGLKLLSCGITDEVSSIRALFLADVLTKEIDCFARLLDGALTEVEQSVSDLAERPPVDVSLS
jgi:4-aminobutyrate aminotransferase-like enzyme